MERILRIVLTVWFGSLWTICAVVAPSLFTVIPDRQLAGQVAGHFFSVETWLGLALGIIAVILLKRSLSANATDYVLVVTTLSAPVASEVAIRPLMASARSAGDMQLFGMLHGASALLFAMACVTALVVHWRLSRQPKRTV